MSMIRTHQRRAVCAVVALTWFVGGEALAQPASSAADVTGYRALLDQYCVTCHSERVVSGAGGQDTPLVSQLRAVGLALDSLDLHAVADDATAWEAVVRKLRAGLMPPAGRPRPDQPELEALRLWLEEELDQSWDTAPDPGRTATFHRLNRAEYRNAIRDLLALDVPVEDLLPADDASFGFDNIGGVLRMSQSLLERYLSASRAISRLAVGIPPPAPFSETFRAAQDEQQHRRSPGLPFGTRGGMLVRYTFPLDADYDIRVDLSGTRGLRDVHELEVTVDGRVVEQMILGPASEDGRGAGVRGTS